MRQDNKPHQSSSTALSTGQLSEPEAGLPGHTHDATAITTTGGLLRKPQPAQQLSGVQLAPWHKGGDVSTAVGAAPATQLQPGHQALTVEVVPTGGGDGIAA